MHFLCHFNSLISFAFCFFVFFQAAQKNYFCQDNNSFGDVEAKVFCGMLGWPTGTPLAKVSNKRPSKILTTTTKISQNSSK
jgi:hypothetical protein